MTIAITETIVHPSVYLFNLPSALTLKESFIPRICRVVLSCQVDAIPMVS